MAALAANLTDEQRLAVQTRTVSIALAAGAGCGKTFVLTQRFLSYLEPGDDGAAAARLSELVAITFTDRAAREMRDRIRRTCTQRMQQAPSQELAQYWLQVLRDLDSARVSTIHSFCVSLLRSHAVEAEVDPRFELLDAAQATSLLHEAIDDTLRRMLAERLPAAMEMAYHFDVARVRSMLAAGVQQRHALDLEQWPDCDVPTLRAQWRQFYEATLPRRVAERLVAQGQIGDLLDLLRRHSCSSAKMEGRRQWLVENLPELDSTPDMLAFLPELREQLTLQGIRATHWDDPEAYPQIKERIQGLRECVDRSLKVLHWDDETIDKAAELGLRYLQLLRPVVTAYEQLKTERACLDFDDLVIRACRLLLRPEHEDLRQRLSTQLHALLVDEFQDTDPVQADLVRTLCGEALMTGKLFLVGDQKQSIYRFRGADPSVFRQLSAEVPEQGRLPLTCNFRSQPQILAFVNALFVEPLGPGYQPLRPSRVQVTPPPAVEFLWANPADEQEEAAETEEDDGAGPAKRNKGDLLLMESDWIARRIRQLLDDGEPVVWDAEAAGRGQPAARPAKAGDVAILFRALSDVGVYESALQRYGIPYYLVGGHAFYAQQEIFDLLNLLRAAAFPDDAVSLAGVLRGPLFSLSDEALYWLGTRGGGLCRSFLQSPPAELDEVDRRRLDFAREAIERLRKRKDRLPLATFLREAMDLIGFDALLLAEFLGHRKLANLNKLVDNARSLAAAGFDLSDYIDYLTESVAEQPKEGLAATQSESMDVVRLMTIHQAKGLEFPIVVVPDLDRRVDNRRSDVRLDPQLGPVVSIPEVEKGSPSHWLGWLDGEEETAESLRLLYVAATRAADYLILSRGAVDLSKFGSLWMKTLAARFDLLTGELVAPLPPDYVQPQIRVTLSRPPEPRGEMQRREPRISEATLERARQAEPAYSPVSVEPIAADLGRRREFSFSRLSGALQAVEQGDDLRDGLDAAEPILPHDFAIPAAGLDSRSLGSLVHAMLERVDFARLPSPRQIRELAAAAARMLPRLALPPQAMDAAVDMTERFCRSPRAKQLGEAAVVHRELEFLLAWPPESADVGSGRFLRGFIDLLYQDRHGGWHLVDFKSNNVAAASVSAAAGRYEMQALVYALAVEKVLQQPPTTLAWHFLAPGVEHVFSLDDDFRRRVRGQIDRGIQQCIQGLPGSVSATSNTEKQDKPDQRRRSSNSADVQSGAAGKGSSAGGRRGRRRPAE